MIRQFRRSMSFMLLGVSSLVMAQSKVEFETEWIKPSTPKAPAILVLPMPGGGMTVPNLAGKEMAPDLASLEAPQPAVIHVRLADTAGLSVKMRAQLEVIVVGLYRKAKLRLDFSNCQTTPDDACHFALRSTDVWVQILKHRPAQLRSDCTGFTILVPSERLTDSYAAVSLPAAKVAAQEMDVPIVDVLAVSMAHEIGHLLLHSRMHSRSGVMSPRLDQRQIQLLERGELGFTREEATRLTFAAK
jgi:hypothetical protein